MSHKYIANTETLPGIFASSSFKSYKLHNNHYIGIIFSLQWDLQVQSGIFRVNLNHRV